MAKEKPPIDDDWKTRRSLTILSIAVLVQSITQLVISVRVRWMFHDIVEIVALLNERLNLMS